MPRSSSTLKRTVAPKIKPIEYKTHASNNNTSVPTNYIPPQQPGLLSTVAQGFAWSTGSTIARNMFESKERVTPSLNKTNEINCFQYKLCNKLNDPEECFSKMDIAEYNVCKKLFD